MSVQYDAFPIPAKMGATDRSGQLDDELRNMPVGKSYLVELSEPNDGSEEAIREGLKRLSNRVSGIVRRFKQKNPGFEFSTRSVDDDVLGRGVRIWRKECKD